MGVDTVAAITRGGSFGMPREDYKLWTTPWGQQVWVPGLFSPTPDGEGGWFVHPQGDTSCLPSGHMPTGCPYFDNIEPKVEFDEDHLDPANNLEEYSVLGEKDLQLHCPQRGRGVRDGSCGGARRTRDGPGRHQLDSWGRGSGTPRESAASRSGYVSPLVRPDYVKRDVRRADRHCAGRTCRRINGRRAAMRSTWSYTCGTDFGHQTGQFCSTAVFRDVWRPVLSQAQRLDSRQHEMEDPQALLRIDCSADTVLHRGWVRRFEPDPDLCREYGPGDAEEGIRPGYRFWGGGVDTQKVLPFGSPEEVRRQALERCEILGKDGGFIFGAIHNVQHGVPVENIVAMIDAVREFNGEC